VKVGADGDKAVLTVTDSGIGIPQEAQTHIFERFYRTDKARSRQMGGTGLGLSIVKSIGAAHGGQVSVQSAEGRGSTFRFEIPRSSVSADAGSASSESQAIASAKPIETS